MMLVANLTPPDDEKSCMLLVMRVLSIVPLNFKASVELNFLRRLTDQPGGFFFSLLPLLLLLSSSF